MLIKPSFLQRTNVMSMTSMVRMDSWEEVRDIAKKANAVTILEDNTTGDAFLSQP